MNGSLSNDRATKFSATLDAPKRENVSSGLTPGEQVLLSDAETRKSISRWIMRLFAVVNIVTLGLILGLAVGDQRQLAAGLIKPDERLIDSQVLMAMLGATTVQLGTIAVIMAKYMFKPPG